MDINTCIARYAELADISFAERTIAFGSRTARALSKDPDQLRLHTHSFGEALKHLIEEYLNVKADSNAQITLKSASTDGETSDCKVYDAARLSEGRC